MVSCSIGTDVGVPFVLVLINGCIDFSFSPCSKPMQGTCFPLGNHIPQYYTKLGNNISHNTRQFICLHPQWSQQLPLHKVNFTPTPDTTVLKFVKVNIFSNTYTQIMKVNIFFRPEEAMLENW